MDGQNTVQVVHTDGLGSVRALTDGNGTVVQDYQTDAFGVPTATDGPNYQQRFQFTGEQRDYDGLVSLRARFTTRSRDGLWEGIHFLGRLPSQCL
jgi:hypothetical protein